MSNTLTIVIIAVILQVLGFIWYGKALFGKVWMRAMGDDCGPNMSEEEKKSKNKGMGRLMFTNVILSLITILVLSWALGNENNVHTAIKLSFIIWFGFAMPMQASGALWSGKPKKLAWDMFLVSTGYQLVAFIVAGALLALW